MKRLLACLLAACLALGGCAAPTPAGSPSASPRGTTGTLRVGIAQIVDHPSLNAIREGFKQGMATAGWVEGKNVAYDEKNAAGEQATLTSIATSFADQDLVVAIATPTALAMAQALGDKPIFFAGVTDPVGAKLVTSLDHPGGDITGTSDLPPVEAQLRLIRDTTPTVKQVGLLYTSGEVNSQITAQMVKDAAPGVGLSIKEATITNSSEVKQGAESLGDVDAYFVGNDNTVVSGIEALVALAEQRKAPLYVSDADSVARGAMAALAVDYRRQGADTAALVAEYLVKGGRPGDYPVRVAKDVQLTVSLPAATRMGVKIPDAVLKKAAHVLR